MIWDNNQLAFFELVRAGLWEKEARLLQFGNIDYASILQLAEEQAVVGLVTAGLEHVVDVKVPQEDVLPFIGSALQIEQQNDALNIFVAQLIEKLRKEDVYTLLLKGQGIAQCYERPLWRTSGDVDLFLSDVNYLKAKKSLSPLAACVEEEYSYRKHIEMNIDQWMVELHGSLHCELWKSLDDVLDKVQYEIFCGGNVRSWLNGKTQVFLPRADEDVAYVFAHILQHFFKFGIGLRQVCDWCRLLWTYKDSLNNALFEKRIVEMGVMTEWKSFAFLAVNMLGMPKEAMPLYDNSEKWKRKAFRVLSFILYSGNMGHNRDMSFRQEEVNSKRKLLTIWHITCDSVRHIFIFPVDSLKVWWSQMRGGIVSFLIGRKQKRGQKGCVSRWRESTE